MAEQDLATRIRERLDGWAPPEPWVTQFANGPENPTPEEVVNFDGMRNALLAVLELHPTVGPHKGTIYQRLMGDHAESNAACARCGESPCPELLAIAKALGIEVDHA